MPALPNLYIVILDEPTPALREAFQEVVVQHTDEWWHQFPDVWIVQGDQASDWRDRFRPLATAAGSPGTSVLVFELPAQGRSWASFGTDSSNRTAWLYTNYTGSREPEATAPEDDIPF